MFLGKWNEFSSEFKMCEKSNSNRFIFLLRTIIDWWHCTCISPVMLTILKTNHNIMKSFRWMYFECEARFLASFSCDECVCTKSPWIWFTSCAHKAHISWKYSCSYLPCFPSFVKLCYFCSPGFCKNFGHGWIWYG